MLRITTSETGNSQKWILEGQLAGPSAGELQASWKTAGGGASKCVVDLTGVTFVDEAGALVLREMKDAGVRFIARGVDTMHLLEDLKRKTAPPLRRCLSWLTCCAPVEKDETKKQ
jgi:anti-anti-sigma regulatory factor